MSVVFLLVWLPCVALVARVVLVASVGRGVLVCC